MLSDSAGNRVLRAGGPTYLAGRRLKPAACVAAGLAILATAGCSGDADGKDAEADGARTTGDELAAPDPGTGLLSLGDDTIQFRVAGCDSSAASAADDDIAHSVAFSTPAVHLILDGVAALPDGRSLQITVLRVHMDTTTWQSVGLDYGTEYWEARRARTGHSDGAKVWREFTDSAKSDSGPLFTVDDGVIRAAGRFVSAEGSRPESRDGRLTAVCPES